VFWNLEMSLHKVDAPHHGYPVQRRPTGSQILQTAKVRQTAESENGTCVTCPGNAAFNAACAFANR
jgi:hypothetical protein